MNNKSSFDKLFDYEKFNNMNLNKFANNLASNKLLCNHCS